MTELSSHSPSATPGAGGEALELGPAAPETDACPMAMLPKGVVEPTCKQRRRVRTEGLFTAVTRDFSVASLRNDLKSMTDPKTLTGPQRVFANSGTQHHTRGTSNCKAWLNGTTCLPRSPHFTALHPKMIGKLQRRTCRHCRIDCCARLARAPREPRGLRGREIVNGLLLVRRVCRRKERLPEARLLNVKVRNYALLLGNGLVDGLQLGTARGLTQLHRAQLLLLLLERSLCV